MQKEVLIAQVLELSETNLPEKELQFVQDCIINENFNKLRVYMESAVSSVQRRLLDSIMISKYDESYADRYRTVKNIDNKITYICQELV